jgi:hypothetical protein
MLFAYFVNYKTNIMINIVLTIIGVTKMSALCCDMPEFFYTNFRALIAIHVAECCKRLRISYRSMGIESLFALEDACLINVLVKA